MRRYDKRDPSLPPGTTERRKHPRTSFTARVSFQIISGRDPKLKSSRREGTLKNISQGGLCFHTRQIQVDGMHISYDDSPLEKNKLLVNVALPPPFGAFTALARVIWFERLGSESMYAVGAEFLQFKEGGDAVLRRFLQEML